MAKTKMESTFFFSSLGTGYFYTDRKNRKKSKGEKKLSIRKYDPIAKQHCLFEEKKAARLKKKWKPTPKVATDSAEAAQK